MLATHGNDRQVWSGNFEHWATHYYGLFCDCGAGRHDQRFIEWLRGRFNQTDFTKLPDGRILAHSWWYPPNYYADGGRAKKLCEECCRSNTPPLDCVELGLYQVASGAPVVDVEWPPAVLREWADKVEARTA